MICEHGSLARSCLVCELQADLAAARRAMRSTRLSLTEQARRDVHMYLVCELEDYTAAEEWELAAMSDAESAAVVAEHAPSTVPAAGHLPGPPQRPSLSPTKEHL